MRHLNLTLFLSILLLGLETHAQNDIRTWITQHGLSTDYPILSNVVLVNSVSYAPESEFYYYDYVLTNSNGNRGNIWYFEIDIRRRPGSIIYDTVGLKFASRFEQGDFQRYYPAGTKAIEAVGFPSLPSFKWVGVIAHNSVASFATGITQMPPGTIVSGFTMMSKALPGIREFTVHPDFDEGKYTPDIDGDTTAALDSIYVAVYNYIDSATRNMNYHGWTIGPTAPPLDFSASSWIDTLISYKHQSVALGWLKEDKTHKQDCDEMMNGRDWYKKGDFEKLGKWNPTNDWDFDRDWNNGIVEVLDRRLDRAKTELSKRDSVGARRDLQIFVMEVELLNSLSKKLEDRKQAPIMTSEAYALLKYNAEYLIEKLPEGRGKN
ncbi:MAG TPA: hypothetical protein VLX91_11260 [Candidatus Acidoferrales bacterium]|nr:hypothetical protein [Candidatus Acidoferrales bacterium]